MKRSSAFDFAQLAAAAAAAAHLSRCDLTATVAVGEQHYHYRHWLPVLMDIAGASLIACDAVELGATAAAAPANLAD